MYLGCLPLNTFDDVIVEWDKGAKYMGSKFLNVRDVTRGFTEIVSV